MSRPPPSMNRPPPQGQHQHAPHDRRPPPPQQYYDDGYQQDWSQGGYDGYGSGQQQGYDQYGANGYHNEQAYEYNGGYGQGGYYDGGYEGYGPGYEQRSPPRQRPPPDDRRRGPPPQQGMRGPPRGAPRQQGPPGSDPRQGRPPRGPPQDQWGRPIPPSSDPRARSRSRPRQRDDRYYDRGPPLDQQQRGWEDGYGGRPPPPGTRGPPRPRPVDGAVYGQMPPQRRSDPYDANGQYGTPGYDPQRGEQGYPPEPQHQRPPPPRGASMRDQQGGDRNRAPLPQFQSVKHHPQDPRPGTSTSMERPPHQQKQLPPQPHTTPATPVDGSFNQSMNQQQGAQQWPAPAKPQAPALNNNNFSLPVRQAPGPTALHTAARSEEMPNFGSNDQSQPSAAYQRPQFQSNDPISPAGPMSPVHQLPPQQTLEPVEMPGDMPVSQPPPHQQYVAPPAQAPQGYRLPQRSQTQSPQGQGQQPNGFGPPRRQMTDGPHAHQDAASRPELPRGPSPYAREEQQQGYAPNGAARYGGPPGPQRQDSNFSDHSGSGRPRTPGGSRPNTAGVDRPSYYPAMDAYGSPQGQGRGPPPNGRAPPQQPPNGCPQQGRPSTDGQRRPFARDPNQQSNLRQPVDPAQRSAPDQGQMRVPPPSQDTSQGPNGTRHARSNSDALPAHPAPTRPSLPNSMSEEKPKPTPVRQYTNNNIDPASTAPTSKPQQTPVTHTELTTLREKCARSPSDSKTHLLLARRLVEASHVLANEAGRADPRTRAANTERYQKEALKIVRKLASAQYPDALFYLADSYGDGALGLPPDPREAFTLYQAAAKLNHPQSAYRTAVCCEIGAEEGGGTKRDFGKAVQWYRRAAQLGDVPSTYKMGVILLKGMLGQAVDVGEAVSYLRKAAEMADSENPHALHELGMIYEAPPPATGSIGGPVKKDEAEALKLFTQSAKLGYKFSQLKLGQCHEYGHLAAPIDARTSIIWYTKAAAQGEHQAELALSGWYLTGAEGILEHSDTEAYLWARKAAAAEVPLPKAMFAMGYFTEVGIGCPRSVEEARRWYGRAAAHNFPKARERLEELRRNGSRTQKPREKLNRGAGGDQKKNDENCIIM